MWLSRALAVKEDEAEATLCLGDLYSRSGNLEEAKKCYDKICSAVSSLPSSLCLLARLINELYLFA